MGRYAFLLLLFAFVSAGFAETDLLAQGSATFSVTASGIIDYEVTGANPEIQDLAFQSFFVPQEESVNVDSLVGGDVVLGAENFFVINAPTLNQDVVYNAVISFVNPAKLFWLDDLELLNDINYSFELQEYLVFDDYVNPSLEMKSKASKIVEGVKYKAEAVLRIADFVHDYVTYDLDVGGEYLLDAKWVYANEKGTCDEFSVLTAALIRSIGVPVRFVHGYVQAEALEGYGPHSYIEVYLSDEWVPFDPTWGQYGFVDVSHIKFMTSSSPEFIMSSVSYKHRDASLTANNPDIIINLDSFEEQDEIFFITGELDRDKYYENDYVVLTLTLNSPLKKSIILPLQVVTTQELELLNFINYLLVDGGTRVARLIFKTPGGVEKNRYFIHPIRVRTPFSNEFVLNVTNYHGVAQSSFSDVEFFLNENDLVENPHVSVEVNFSDKFYDYTSLLNVSFFNDGNMILDLLEVRIPNHNLVFNVPSLSINNYFTIQIPLNYSTQGVHNEKISVYNNGLLLESYSFVLENIETPEINISAFYNVSGEFYNLTVLLEKNFEPRTSILSISSGDFSESKEFKKSNSFLIPVELAGMSIDLELIIVDIFGEQYNYFLRVDVEMSLFEKIVYYIKRFIKLLLYS
ncbi:MAG: transglutaminase domain-containing protein [Nanoarchaeota archaeon]|nr:transglutaminase domain-containing protein [Nanoarchaeota archaeon]